MSERDAQIATSTVGIKVVGASIYGTYDTARGVASIFAFIGWLIVVVSIMAGMAGLSVGPPLLIIAISVGIAAIGLLLVAAQQMLRASVDSADYSRQALLLQIGLAEGRTQIDLTRSSSNEVKAAPTLSAPSRQNTQRHIDETYEYGGRKILKIGADYFIEGHDQPYNSLYTARLVIDRGDV